LVAYDGYARLHMLNGTTDPPGTPFTDPGTITITYGGPGHDWAP
jgi:hypothetical protein